MLRGNTFRGIKEIISDEGRANNKTEVPEYNISIVTFGGFILFFKKYLFNCVSPIGQFVR